MADSLILADQIELLAGGQTTGNPLCPNARIMLADPFDFGSPAPEDVLVANLLGSGERASGRKLHNRQPTLGIVITAPDRYQLAAARELVMSVVNDLPSFRLTWTRDPGPGGTPQPVVLECLAASAVVVDYSIKRDRQLVATMQVPFQAAPYLHSDLPVTVPVASPLTGTSAPPAPVVLDTFSSVSGVQWQQSNRCAVGPKSARFRPDIAPLSDATGSNSVPAYYKATFASKDLTGLTHLSFWLGLGTDYWDTWHRGRILFTCTLTDSSGRVVRFAHTRDYTDVAKGAGTPNWRFVSITLPFSKTFNYAAVTGYSISMSNRGYKGFRYGQAYLDAVTVNPPSLQPLATTRGYVYNVQRIQGTARTPCALQFTQALLGTGVQVTEYLPGPPGTQQTFTCPPGVTAAKIEAGGASGAAGSTSNPNNAGGGSGAGEYAAEAAAALTPGNQYIYTIGQAGQPRNWTTGTDGGDTSFQADAVLITAHGGKAGQGGVANGAGGLGGTGSLNGTHFNGGAGSAGTGGTRQGSGGGSAGSGGAGGAGGTLTGGAAGAGATPGAKGRAGGPSNGSGSPGDAPGGGASGAQTTGGGLNYSGGRGRDGYIKVTYTTTVPQFSTLIAHAPSIYSPDNLCPLVALSSQDTPDGSVEYPVPSIQPGQNADFSGTYTAVVVNNTWHNPSAARTVRLQVNQYEYAGGPVYSSSVTRNVVPNSDVVNGIIVVGELTLPLKDVADDNSTAYYTVTITSGDTADTFLDAMFLDTMGQTVIVNVPTAQAYNAYYIDAPIPTRDLGRVLGATWDRQSAVSVLDWSICSGGPITLDPEDTNLLLVYAVEGAPNCSLTYFPQWYLDRVDRIAP